MLGPSLRSKNRPAIRFCYWWADSGITCSNSTTPKAACSHNLLSAYQRNDADRPIVAGLYMLTHSSVHYVTLHSYYPRCMHPGKRVYYSNSRLIKSDEI